jgi:hypothetical protein
VIHWIPSQSKECGFRIKRGRGERAIHRGKKQGFKEVWGKGKKETKVVCQQRSIG